MEKRWVYNKEAAPEVINGLAESLKISPTLASILCQRSICTFEVA